jgi:FtsZ-interacting cell division protein ZipA
MGIYPWFRCQTVHTWYDPLFVYDRWHFGRTEPDWAKRQAREFDMRRANRDLRPARTYAELQVQMARLPAARRPERPLVQSVKAFAGSQSTPVKFERITAAERQQLAVKSTEVRNFRDQRNHWESPAGQPASPVSPVTRQQPPTQTRPAPATSARQPVAQPATKPANQPKQPKSVPAPQVRVTRPEQVVVPKPPITATPSESRYIEKVAPGHPAQEHSRTDATSTTKSPGKDSRGKSQPNDSQGRDRKR